MSSNSSYTPTWAGEEAEKDYQKIWAAIVQELDTVVPGCMKHL